MADNHLITGYWGEPHVTSENDRGINAATFGTGRFVLPVGQKFRAEYIGNNTIRMYDGKLMDNGAAAGIPAGEYIDLLVSDAGQGMNRKDLIIFQYSQDTSTLIETGIFIVLQGAETSGTAVDPELTQDNLLSGKATFDQFALWRVSVSGSSISAPEQLFDVARSLADGLDEDVLGEIVNEAITENATPKSHANDKNNPHGVTADQIGAAQKSHASTGTDHGKGSSVYYGHVKLSADTDDTSGVSGGVAATPSAVKAAYDLANGKAPQSHVSSDTKHGAASTTQYGHVKLSNSFSEADAQKEGMAASALQAAQLYTYFTEVIAELDAKAPAYTYGTTDKTAGSDTLATGTLYFVYE